MLTLKLEQFKRYKNIDYYNRNFFSAIKDAIDWAQKISLTIFFTPVVAITSLFTKNGLLIVANGLISICQVANVLFRYAFNLITLSDLALSFIGMGLFVFYFISATPNFFPLAYTFNNLIFLANIVATAIYSFFLLQDVIIPPAKNLLEMLFKLFDIQSDGVLFSDLKFDKERDTEILNVLMHQIYKHDLFDQSIDNSQKDDEVKVFNNMLQILVDYSNKYNSLFLGSILRQIDLKKMDKLINELIVDGNTSNVIKFIEKKYGFKVTKVKKLEDARDEMRKAVIDEPKLDEYNELLLKYFNDSNKVSARELQSSFNNCSKLFQDEIDRQNRKINKLKAAIPKKK